MNYKKLDDAQIQALKSQEAKDVACDLLEELRKRDKGPITPGQVQLFELEYELKLKQAEVEDGRLQRTHERELRELELQLEQKREENSRAVSQADAIRRELMELVDRVRNSEESLAVSLERATREHRLRIEELESQMNLRKQDLDNEIDALQTRKAELLEQINQLSDIQLDVAELSSARDEVTKRQTQLNQEKQKLDDEIKQLEFERHKKVTEVSQTQELELAKLRHEHEKQTVVLDREAADKILAGLGLVATEKRELDSLHNEIASLKNRQAEATQIAENEIRERMKREFNITSAEPVDVTALHYQHQAAVEQLKRMESRVAQLESELEKARTHIQGEPQRIATAVEAARTPIQNIVEPAGKR